MTVSEDLDLIIRLKVLQNRLDRELREVRDRLHDRAVAQLAEDGAAPTWRVAGRGTVGLAVSAARPCVVDPERFEEFLFGRYGEEAFETIRRVRPDAMQALAGECQQVGGLHLVTPDGEQVPGLVLQAAPPVLQVRLSKEAKAGVEVDAAFDAELAAVEAEA